MTSGPSPIPPGIREIVTESYVVNIATRDAELMPECAQGWGFVPLLEERRALVFVPRACLGRTAANLNDNGRLALTISRLADLRTYQLKGRGRLLRDAEEREREFLRRYSAMFAEGAEHEGLADMIRRIEYWPCAVIEMEIDEVFAQTPGPGTGKRIEP